MDFLISLLPDDRRRRTFMAVVGTTIPVAAALLWIKAVPSIVLPPVNDAVWRRGADSGWSRVHALDIGSHVITGGPDSLFRFCRILLGKVVCEIEKTSPPIVLPLNNSSAVDEALARLKAANVAFNSPGRAKVGRPFIIEAMISTNLPETKMRNLIQAPGSVAVEPLKVSDRVAASLVGGPAFEIPASGSSQQWVSGQEPTIWKWTVTPKVAGEKQILLLSFDALVTVDGKEDRRNVNTFQREIDVDVSWPETIPEWLEFIKKNGENATWIWAALIIPLAGGAWAWTTGKKSENDAEKKKPVYDFQEAKRRRPQKP